MLCSPLHLMPPLLSDVVSQFSLIQKLSHRMGNTGLESFSNLLKGVQK